ncbi:DNA cytosine methyltransferase [Undibacterium sp. 14-3-2]|uniref:DNA cytosine methyltransferase n=1 Tax=Undibacterium sp. 14-3-2 TaxID=2800129 RepID=UPI0019036809|nr:DNA cytosine methyltransferase [Undibacterium sp. 14-3-2]MBK1888599.1 DNA cytosine methyltransferase [Undibacterium sp. 14-3-2]
MNKEPLDLEKKMKEKPMIFSFFSGSGFLDLGFENSGFDVCFVNEFHKPFIEAHKYSRQLMKLDIPSYGYFTDSIEAFVDGDKSKVLSDLVNNAKDKASVGFIGGPPCPDFSVAGKNKGSTGENGRLTKVYVDCILKNTPDFFLFENVKGLWRTARHRAFYEEMKSALRDAGYILTDRLTNSIEFGAPQDRDRILMFGVKQDAFNISNDDELENKFKWGRDIKFDKNTVLNKDLWPKQESFSVDSNRSIPFSVVEFESLTVEYWFKKNVVDQHPNASHHFTPRQALSRFKTIGEGDDAKKSFKRLHRWRYSPTAAYGNNEVHLHPYKERRLSAAEALAIQSLPKEFVLPPTMTLSNMFKTIGNGVPYLLALAIAKEIFSFVTNFETPKK